MMEDVVSLDRLAVRERPAGLPIMHQDWNDLLFLHWPIDASLIRPLIPKPLEIDTFQGQAWVSVTPFNLTNLRLTPLPPVPGLDSFLELNVRTYVDHEGVPGVWFFSLDASKTIPVVAARLVFTLPYFKAEMSLEEEGGNFEFFSKRLVSPAAGFEARWSIGTRLGHAEPGSLAFFLVERYCLFAGKERDLTMTRIHHRPWILDEATHVTSRSTMFSVLKLPEPIEAPLPHFSRLQSVEVWAPERV
jgi:uncharacterized protein